MNMAQLTNEQLLEIVAQQSERIAVLEQQLRVLLQRQYGTRSEIISPDQLKLFDPASLPATAQTNNAEDEVVSVGAHKKKKGKRSALDPKFERRTVHHELPEVLRQCGCGAAMKDIGHETSEQFDYIPARMVVIEHVQHKYACPCCQETIVLAPKPAQPLPKTNAAAGLVAHIATTKFVDGVPLHRQETQFERMDVHLPRNTMARWLIQVAQLILPLLNLMEDALRAGRYIQCDETPFKVLKEVGRAASALSYMWVRRGGEPSREVVLYHYEPSRSGVVACRLLEGYQGYVQCDGYSAYLALETMGIVLVGCMAHLRRKFVEALKSASSQEVSQKAKASEAIRYIKKLYAIEDQIRDQSEQVRLDTRQAQAVPVLAELKLWLDAQAQIVLPKSPLGKAVNYALNQWTKVIRYCDQGYLEIDNNGDERAIRPFAIGRANWLFSDTPDGAHTNARFYSLIETCKLHGHEPYAYLKHIFKELPLAVSVADYEALLPWNLDTATLKTAAVQL